MREPSPIDYPLYNAVLAPFARLFDGSWRDWTIGMIGAGLTALWNDLFILLWVWAWISAITDTMYGRRLHRILDRYDPVKAEIGMHGKLAGLTMALIVRGVEWTIAARVLPELNGLETWLATAVENAIFSSLMAGTLLGQDLRSIQEKRERFGQPPIPVFSTAMRLLEKMIERLAGPPPDAELQHRREDDPGHHHRREEDDEG